jgi:glycosyltransferase involved in cell wall biosynthesis
MNLVIALEHRFFRTPDGSYWSETLYPRPFWSRYLSVFSQLGILARVHDTPTKSESWKRVDGDRVSFVPIPAYVGPSAFLLSFLRVRAAVQNAGLDRSAVILRVPGMIASVVSSCLERGRPYGVEVIGDPLDVFSRHAVSHPLRPFFRWWFTRTLKRQCQEAACSLYVTDHALQDRYPPGTSKGGLSASGIPQEHLSVGASDADLQDPAFVNSVADTRQGERFRLIHVGTLEVLYKAPDVLLGALARCVAEGLNGELVMIGDGRERPRMERLAQRLRVADRVKFLGQLPAGEAVRRELDTSDLFVLPSRQEGMPRALIEAMARGLPCIGTTVGGIPELLPDVALVPRNDVNSLAAKILQFARDPKLRAALARMNLTAARRYHESILQPKRVAFYERLRDITEAWRKIRSERQR